MSKATKAKVVEFSAIVKNVKKFNTVLSVVESVLADVTLELSKGGVRICSLDKQRGAMIEVNLGAKSEIWDRKSYKYELKEETQISIGVGDLLKRTSRAAKDDTVKLRYIEGENLLRIYIRGDAGRKDFILPLRIMEDYEKTDIPDLPTPAMVLTKPEILKEVVGDLTIVSDAALLIFSDKNLIFKAQEGENVSLYELRKTNPAVKDWNVDHTLSNTIAIAYLEKIRRLVDEADSLHWKLSEFDGEPGPFYIVLKLADGIDFTYWVAPYDESAAVSDEVEAEEAVELDEDEIIEDIEEEIEEVEEEELEDLEGLEEELEEETAVEE